MTRLRAAAWAAFLAAALLAMPAAAQPRYPERNVRIVVAFAPGGATDLLGRILADGLSRRLNRSFVVDNRPGASGNVGTASVAQAEPDGYTLLLGTIATQSVNNHLYVNPGYNAATDFAPISLVASLPNLIVVSNAVPARTLQELIAHARANPGRLNYGSTGVGGSPHLIVELMKIRYGLQIVHVPYRGSAPIQTALISNEVQLAADNMSTALPHVRAGSTRALAVTGGQRSAAAPDVPTVVEAGAPDLLVTAWFGLVAPARTAEPIVELLSREVAQILAEPAVRERLGHLGATPHGSTPAEFASHISAERARWAEVIRAAGIRPE
jgi:tripartite-type tricarboxylate transporter receptor subunit TctC